jgi:hypothetical protein
LCKQGLCSVPLCPVVVSDFVWMAGVECKCEVCCVLNVWSCSGSCKIQLQLY